MNAQHTRRAALATLAGGAIALLAAPAGAQTHPSAQTILRRLGAAPAVKMAPNGRVTMNEIKRRPDLRHIAPSIDIQSINFAFGSAHIPPREAWKIEAIAIAMRHLLGRNGDEVFLVEGHTDAVGSNAANLHLSQARAVSVAGHLTRYGVPRQTMETIGYGEEDLLVPTPNADWRNRRVTLRRITDLLVY